MRLWFEWDWSIPNQTNPYSISIHLHTWTMGCFPQQKNRNFWSLQTQGMLAPSQQLNLCTLFLQLPFILVFLFNIVMFVFCNFSTHPSLIPLKFAWNGKKQNCKENTILNLNRPQMAYFLSPILIAHWPYLKMKNSDFFLQNFLDCLKILDLSGAGAYPAKPNHTQSP